MLDRLIEICQDYAEVEPGTIDRSSDLRADLGLNSLELAHMLVVLEDEFCIEIPDRDAMSFITIGDVETYINNKLS